MATDEERIGKNKFNLKFRDALRDCFVYGVKTNDELKNPDSQNVPKKQSENSIRDNIQRLKRIMNNYCRWSVRKNKGRLFMSESSELMDFNPLKLVYFYCKIRGSEEENFFLPLFLLSEKLKLRDDVYETIWDKDLWKYDEEEVLEYCEGFVERNEPDGEWILTTQDIKLFSRLLDMESVRNVELNTSTENKLVYMEEQGLIKDNREGINDKHRWSRGELLLSELCHQDDSFTSHFKDALYFYSSFLPLGEGGDYLLNRLGGKKDNPFRFQNENFFWALNDYNIIDIFSAMEGESLDEKKLCAVMYYNSMKDINDTWICYVLQLRMSLINGKQYVAVYCPLKHAYTTLRLEFITEVKVIEDRVIRDSTGRVLLDRDDPVCKAWLKEELANAKEAIDATWGVSGKGFDRENAKTKPGLTAVTLPVICDPEKEGYFVEALEKMKRFGTITKDSENKRIYFNAEVTDDYELKPFIRTLYSWIDVKSIDEDLGDWIKKDIDSWLKVYEEGLELPKKFRPYETKSEELTFNQMNLYTISDHEMLFNEVFSFYHFVYGNALTELAYIDKDKFFTKKEIYGLCEKIAKTAIERVKLDFGANQGDEDAFENLSESTSEILDNEVFWNQGYIVSCSRRSQEYEWKSWSDSIMPGLEKKDGRKPRFINKSEEKISYGLDILPLTNFEKRWLKTMAYDPYIDIFLDNDEVTRLRKYLPEKIKPFDMEKVVYFDGYREKDVNGVIASSKKNMDTLLAAIHKKVLVSLAYEGRSGEIFKLNRCAPLKLQYSRKTDMFHVVVYDFEADRITILQLMKIMQLDILSETAPEDVSKSLETMEKKAWEITLEFYDGKNKLDNVLTAFSPWKKECQGLNKDGDSKIYRLKIWYMSYDFDEIVQRLMGFGPALLITGEKNNGNKSVLEEIKSRILSQRKLYS